MNHYCSHANNDKSHVMGVQVFLVHELFKLFLLSEHLAHHTLAFLLPFNLVSHLFAHKVLHLGNLHLVVSLHYVVLLLNNLIVVHLVH